MTPSDTPGTVADTLTGGPRRRRGRGRGRSGVPIALLLPALLGLAFLVLPLIALLVRTPWSHLPDQLTSPAVWQALRLSLLCATAATALSLVIGVPLAWLLARVAFPGRGLVRALVTLPLVLPPVVGGVALLMALGRNGIVGRLLDDWFGITLPFTTAGVVVAEAFVAMPFLVISVEGTLRAADPRYEEAAATLGASRFTAFRRITLPLIAPGVISGALFAFATSFDEVVVTLFLAGPQQVTLPRQMFTGIRENITPTIAAVATLLILFTTTLLLTLEWLRGRRR